jgi:hypothetical protein
MIGKASWRKWSVSWILKKRKNLNMQKGLTSLAKCSSLPKAAERRKVLFHLRLLHHLVWPEVLSVWITNPSGSELSFLPAWLRNCGYLPGSEEGNWAKPFLLRLLK